MRLDLADKLELRAGRKDMVKDTAKIKGVWNLVHKDINGNVIEDEVVENLITNEGFDYILDSSLHAVADVGIWYFIPFITAFTAAVGSTYAAGGGGTEGTNYTEATRQAWGEGASSSQSITNASAATITADTGGLAVLGVGIAGAATAGNTGVKEDTATADAVLLAEVASVKTLAVGETLDITYTVSKT